MNRSLSIGLSLACVSFLAACAEVPSEPTVAVMPSPYKPMEVFQSDDQICRGYAQQQAKASADHGNGNGSGYYADSYLQYRYNLTYEQCMYSKGNQVPNYAPPATVPAPPQSLPPPPPRQ